MLDRSLFRYANFSGSVWDRAFACDCDLKEASLTEMKLTATEWSATDLTGAELCRSSLKGMDLTSCTLGRIVLTEGCGELKGVKIAASQAAVVARILGIEVED